MPDLRAPRGVADILPADQPYWRWLRDTAIRVAESYGYGEIQTPVFERSNVWIHEEARGTDLVDKELYLFEDRGGDQLVLRPEGTPAVCRAYLEHGMASSPQPVRLFYISNFFRYDRPQAGRYRMFHQFGVEAIGDGDPTIDAEVLDLLRTFYETLGLTRYRLLLNSIGDPVCRPAYIEKLRAYYADKLDRLCGDCRRRYDVNPLRMLDCKNEPCQPFKAAAPRISDNLCDACSEHFARLRRLLDGLGIAYTLDPTLVRGLHYYTRTAFEFEPSDGEGQQSAIGGGGRYDGLMEQLGGQPTPGIGFGAGLERIMLNLKRLELGPTPPASLTAYIAVVDDAAQGPALSLARELRSAGASIVTGAAGRSLRSQLRQANALGSKYALVIGSKEIESATVTLRDLSTSDQQSIALPDVVTKIASATAPS